MELLKEISRKKSLTHEFRGKKIVQTKCEFVHSHFSTNATTIIFSSICIVAVAKFVFLSVELRRCF